MYEQDIRPILKANCFPCHGEGDKLSGNLDVRLRRSIVQGGKSGPAIAPGNPEESLLYRRVRDAEMPPGDKKKLSPSEVALIGGWISAGAATLRPEPEALGDDGAFTEEERRFWAFQPIARPEVPRVRGADRVRTAIDAFLLARLEAQGLTFSPDADKPTLIRRASFDLTGLPPTPEELSLFLADDAPDAYDRLIDRLLASPHYGERWGRHWLDVAGYADSEGYSNEDPVRKEAYKYRDYVIRSLNADKPLDQFVQEQLAGDEMIDRAIVERGYQNLPADAVEKLVATGFLRMAPDGTGSGGVDQKLARNQVVADNIKIVSTTLLGLTVGCAQCHNHRYDPIPQADYYRLRAIFEPALDAANWRPPQARLISLYSDADRTQAAATEAEAAKQDAERTKKQQEFIEQVFERELAKLPEELRESVRAARAAAVAQRTPEQAKLLTDHPSVNVSAGSLYLYDQKAADELKQMAEAAAKIRATKPPEEFIRALTEVPGRVPVTHLFHRGDPDQPKQVVAPGGLSILAAVVLGPIAEKNDRLPTTGRRLAFAQRLTSGSHPLTARVLVNRVWMHHFGRGIVGTPGDFGFLGERPTHPELLDWLAMELVNPSHTPPYEGGKGAWRLKRLHKLLMISTVYRQSARRAPTQDAADPDNRLLGRMPVRRLEAESLRDAMLAVSGKLNGKMFGAPVPVMEDEFGQFVVGIENKNGENRPGPVIPLGGDEFRRSIYVLARRSRPLSVLEAFDQPAMEPNCEARSASTVAPQSLLLMNNEFVITQARRFAERVLREAGNDPRQQVAHAWRLAFDRDPSAAEADGGVAFVAEQADHFPAQPAAEPKKAGGKEAGEAADPGLRALASFCQALLSADEFLYVD